MERKDAERELGRMIDEYQNDLPKIKEGIFGLSRKTDTRLAEAVNSSPYLHEQLVKAVQNDQLTKFTAEGVQPGTGASYNEANKTIKLPPSALDNRNDLVFTLGHETQHALQRHEETSTERA